MGSDTQLAVGGIFLVGDILLIWQNIQDIFRGEMSAFVWGRGFC